MIEFLVIVTDTKRWCVAPGKRVGGEFSKVVHPPPKFGWRTFFGGLPTVQSRTDQLHRLPAARSAMMAFDIYFRVILTEQHDE